MGSIANSNSKGLKFLQHIKSHIWLYILFLPGALYFIIFKYTPMFGVVIAFQNYNPFQGFMGSEFVGLEHFKNFLISPDFWLLLKNTLAISLISLIFYFPLPIIIALLLNEMKNQGYKRAIQTLIYIPHFVSFVIVASLTYTLFNINNGLIHELVLNITGKSVDILASPQYFRTMIVGQSMWKESGYGTIIFLAALSGVDMELYEAARVDGAGRWRLMWHITLPAIRSTIIIMLILRVGSVLNTGYEQIYLMSNDLNRSKAEVFDTYVYTKGVLQGQYSYSTAVGLFKSLISMILVLGADRTAKLYGESGIY